MKYLKKFENIINEIDLKKYIIIKKDHKTDKQFFDFYYLLEFQKIEQYSGIKYAQCKKLYSFLTKIKKGHHQFFSLNLEKPVYNVEIIYQSDDYEKILDIFKAVKDIKKYNI